uniref:glutathione-specific gamma-glutamylcyclotransferase n=1 Tax=Ditylenchus dipsaci TaxID=166011 RepID=A0A915D679_9BILA
MYIFGYGSLLWYTDFDYVEAVPGVVSDYVRRFWQLSPDHRGTPDSPGRVVSLVKQKGGKTWGMAYKIPDEAIESTLAYLNYRERAGYKREQVSGNANSTDENEIVNTILMCRGNSGSNLEYALRLADCQRRLAPHHRDEHLFEIETRLLKACEKARVEDEILRQLDYKLNYLIEKIQHKVGSYAST